MLNVLKDVRTRAPQNAKMSDGSDGSTELSGVYFVQVLSCGMDSDGITQVLT